jgi:PAS domain S-box-containing protein
MARQTIQPIDKERVMRDGDFIVSKTDLKGRITYANKIFKEFSGFTENEFLGKQHNLVRHPDMPRCVFKLLWEHIQNGQEIFAFVKNICKDGGYYWVWANVTPSMDAQGNVLGYYSVRRKPNPKAIPHVAALYRQLLQIEQTAGSRDAIEASRAHLLQLLNQQGVSYERFILDLQSL